MPTVAYHLLSLMFDFRGRIARLPYFFCTAATCALLIASVYVLVDAAGRPAIEYAPDDLFASLAIFLLALGLMLGSLASGAALMTKRLRDIAVGGRPLLRR